MAIVTRIKNWETDVFLVDGLLEDGECPLLRIGWTSRESRDVEKLLWFCGEAHKRVLRFDSMSPLSLDCVLCCVWIVDGCHAITYSIPNSYPTRIPITRPDPQLPKKKPTTQHSTVVHTAHSLFWLALLHTCYILIHAFYYILQLSSFLFWLFIFPFRSSLFSFLVCLLLLPHSLTHSSHFRPQKARNIRCRILE